MPREYRHIEGYEKEIIRLWEEGKTLRQIWIILKKEDRKSKRSVGQIGRQAIIMRMRAERVIKAVDILKNGKL